MIFIIFCAIIFLSLLILSIVNSTFYDSSDLTKTNRVILKKIFNDNTSSSDTVIGNSSPDEPMNENLSDPVISPDALPIANSMPNIESSNLGCNPESSSNLIHEDDTSSTQNVFRRQNACPSDPSNINKPSSDSQPNDFNRKTEPE